MTVTDRNEELREIPAETRRPQTGGWRGMGVPTERSENFAGSVRRLWELLRPERPLLALIGIMAIVTTSLNVVGPKVLGRATDVIVTGVITPEGIDFHALHRTLLQVTLIYAGAAALGVLIAYVLAGVVQRLMFRLRAQAEAKLNALPLSYIDHQPRGDLLSRVTNDLDNVAQSLQQTMSQMLTSVLLMVSSCGIGFMHGRTRWAAVAPVVHPGPGPHAPTR